MRSEGTHLNSKAALNKQKKKKKKSGNTKQVINIARNDFQSSLAKQNLSKWLENHPW